MASCPLVKSQDKINAMPDIFMALANSFSFLYFTVANSVSLKLFRK